MNPITGQLLLNRATDLAGVDYTNYLSPGQQADTWFAKAFIEVIDKLFLGIQDQSNKDELDSLIVSNYVIPVINPASNSIILSPITAKNITYTGTLLTITTLLPHNLITGQFIALSKCLGLTPAPDGIYLVTVISPTQFSITVSVGPSGTYTFSSGVFFAFDPATDLPIQMIDYLHLLNVVTTYVHTIYPPKNVPTMIINSSSDVLQPIRIKMFTYNNLRSKDQITLAGFSLNTNANGTFYIREANLQEFDLFQDKDFQIPVVPNGAFVAGDPMTISKTWIKSSKQLNPDERIDPFSASTPESPRHLESDLRLNFYPQPGGGIILKSISMDYIRTPMNIYNTANGFIELQSYPYISTLDNVLDLTTYYHPRLIERLPEAVISLIARVSNNAQLMQESQVVKTEPA